VGLDESRRCAIRLIVFFATARRIFTSCLLHTPTTLSPGSRAGLLAYLGQANGELRSCPVVDLLDLEVFFDPREVETAKRVGVTNFVLYDSKFARRKHVPDAT